MKTKILIVGKNNCGKTSLLKCINPNDIVYTEFANNFVGKTAKLDNVIYISLDIDKLVLKRGKQFLEQTNKIIVVIDTTDTVELKFYRYRLEKYFGKDHKLLIFCNKKDMDSSIGTDDIIRILNLDNSSFEWKIQDSIFPTKQGVYEGLEYFK